MKRSRRGLFGLLALAVVSVVGMTSCASPDVLGWHYVSKKGEAAIPGGTFVDQSGCVFRLSWENQLLGTRVTIEDATPGKICGNELPKVRLTKLSCTYITVDGTLSYPEVAGDTCSTLLFGHGTLLFVNMGYTEPPPTGG